MIDSIKSNIVKVLMFLRGALFIGRIDKNECVLVCPYGIGDILVADLLIKKVVKERNVVFLIREGYAGLATMLKSAEYCICDTYLCRCVEQYIILSKKYKTNRYVYGHFCKNKDLTLRGDQRSHQYFWQDYCCNVYKTEKDSMYQISKRVNSDYTTQLGDFGTKKVILSPYAYSLSQAETTFWTELARGLQEKGYNVYTSVALYEKEIEGTKRLSCGLDELATIANTCAAVVASRSGVCDLLAVYSCAKLIVINPNRREECYLDLRYLREENIFNLTVEEGGLTSVFEIIERGE